MKCTAKTKTTAQYFILLENEHYCDGMFELAKQGDKYLNANSDHTVKQILICSVS
jgi:hypothetical protein